MRLGQDSAEQIRRHEVTRALKKVNLSPEEAEVIERLSRSLVAKLLDGPISKVLARAEVEISCGDRPGPEVSGGFERYGGGVEPPGSKSDHQIGESANPHFKSEFEIGSNRVSSKPA